MVGVTNAVYRALVEERPEDVFLQEGDALVQDHSGRSVGAGQRVFVEAVAGQVSVVVQVYLEPRRRVGLQLKGMGRDVFEAGVREGHHSE